MMTRNEEVENSLPYIDERNGEDDEIDGNRSRYSLSIKETYGNKNRNIEIKNQSSDEFGCDSLSPIAPLAEENDLTDEKVSDSPEDEDDRFSKKVFSKPTVMKVIVKGCNSTISIQGMDNRTSITLSRKSKKKWQEKEAALKRNKEIVRESPLHVAQEKSKRRKWKMLTKSLISKSIRCDKRKSDERYPKYVLLKNEEDEEEREKERITKIEKENFRKIDAVTENNLEEKKTQKKNSDFNMKRSFKNKTKPIYPEQEVLKARVEDEESKSEADKDLKNEIQDVKKRTKKKKMFAEEERKTLGSTSKLENENSFNACRRSSSQDLVFNEIEGVLKEALKLYSGSKDQNAESIEQSPEKLSFSEIALQESFSGTPSQFCQLANYDCSHVCQPVPPPIYISLCDSAGRIRQVCNSDTQTEDEQPEAQKNIPNFQFGILSTAFPPSVMIMKTYEQEYAKEEDCITLKDYEKTGSVDQIDVEGPVDVVETLKVPQTDLTIKSKAVDKSSFRLKIDPELTCDPINELSSSTDEDKTKTDDTEPTKYFGFRDPGENESTTTTCTLKTDPISGDTKPNDDLSLTKIGHKMYDHLTKLSLNREKEIVGEAEANGCGCNGNENKNSICHMRLDSGGRFVRISMPEEKLNLEIVSGEDEEDVQIGFAESESFPIEKKTARKSELWHADDVRKDSEPMTTEKKKNKYDARKKGYPNITLTVDDKRKLFLSIEANEKNERTKNSEVKLVKEVNVGTDDFDLAGGNFVTAFGENFTKLSPRKGQLLKNLQEKLQLNESRKNCLSEKMNKRSDGEKSNCCGNYPEIFLVRQIDESSMPAKKNSSQTRSTTALATTSSRSPFLTSGSSRELSKNPEKLREYYCEDCLATMRIFEDKNPSVKNMVDKFETIIRLESY